eukprot:CAMPEP_0201246318 /NCGR_PEP_ID=MMETSP0852-20130820/50863_1 /ASSEMBLY_ACC=CAM_ASM_000632 /TAXON_ID=183588 /ORGANISM="Pseudo-nitzschia fraudulenta, Strain WWA7" /LENGTH=102 /DNA_ID=CAMNT_0047544449 /DNA_START=207 /DNA_END=512 /DNA_ORIENTATION=+
MAANSNSINGNNGNSNRSCVRKQYLAKVKGRFPSTDDDSVALPRVPPFHCGDALARWKWTTNDRHEMAAKGFGADPQALVYLQVDAPIETVDPVNGVRKITS